jgi:hypothetical protein
VGKVGKVGKVSAARLRDEHLIEADGTKPATPGHAKLPLVKEIEEFDFAGTPVNESLTRSASFMGARLLRGSRLPAQARRSAARRRDLPLRR